MSPLVDNSSPVPNSARATISLAFFGSGFLLASWVVHIPRVRTLLGLSDGELGLILWAATFGLLLGMTLGGWIVERFRSQRVTGFTLCCLGVATVLTVISANRFALALALIPFGFLHGLIDVSMNSQAAAFEQRTGRAAMSSFHAFFSLGGLIGTLFGVALLAMRLSPFIQAPVTSLPFTIAGLFMYRGFIPEERREHGNGFFISFPSGKVLPLALMAFVFFLTEGAIYDWSGVFLRTHLGVDISAAGIGYAGFADDGCHQIWWRFLGCAVWAICRLHYGRSGWGRGTGACLPWRILSDFGCGIRIGGSWAGELRSAYLFGSGAPK